MNNVVLSGRIVRDISFTETANGTKIARLSVAVQRDKENADFPTVVAFGANAEFVNKWFQKGSPIEVVGQLQTGSYEKDGVKHYTTDVVARSFGFPPQRKAGTTNEAAPEPVEDTFTELAEDVPF